ncbi:VPLPA-CTERM sorting domain-containing protein [Hyphococcus flavus]|uniref:VPLPA-CTERM sorting domain-containing protein n=1 Tax=Hyphococcus flavus TaxID=1866326 RepID=A0AAF0CGQ6_9PROT|nr:VPLPA-CTERM sorting domain-containing protein [Hyphococcus flavus]WDI30957.1 VPLPA-CTERM sorting domain-containing protein [Hyphococcus flavus]
MNFKSAAFAALSTFFAGSFAAEAAPINFATEAAIGGERGLENGAIFTASNGEQIRLTSGGTATDGSENIPAPYLDGLSNGRPAGLGVCTLEAGPGSECERNNEDNVTGDQDEFIEFGFLDDSGQRLFSLMGISFRDADHFDISGSNDFVQVSVDGGVLETLTFAGVVSAAASGMYANAETLRLVGVALSEGGREFYINAVSDVPIPAALPLLISGLIGLGFAAKRKKTYA